MEIRKAIYSTSECIEWNSNSLCVPQLLIRARFALSAIHFAHDSIFSPHRKFCKC